MQLAKRWSVVLLLLVLAAATALAGCSGSGSNQKAGGASEGAAEGGSTQSGDEGGGSKPTLKILQTYAKHNYDTPVTDFLEQATGYKVQYDMLPQDNAQDKLNLIMSSGADYDLVKAGKQDYFRFALNGALTDLTPLIDKYGPNIKADISQISFDAVKVDGKIYAIPDLNTS